MKTIRCAIYTRKSSDEGLEQSFSSLDAQRDACAAYILSQASEGWAEVSERYDDGGLSGGTLERPGLKRLLADVAAGGIDIIVVYKVDRLTRSLLDFAKLVEAFDKTDTSFVSITQSFNTTSSLGRLTLNMLLSFAQFEREVTTERIRDKIAASKAKGMWMGGFPPLGYRPEGRSLAIVEEHAALVRQIFARYVELGTVRRLAETLAQERVYVPCRAMSTGRLIGGRPFSRGQLYLMLKCQVYTGRIQHGSKTYPGLHPAIIDQDVWDAVQAQLRQHVQGERHCAKPSPSLLTGRIFDEAGQPLIATHTSKPRRSGRKRYRYYVSRQLHHGHVSQGLRLPASRTEALVTATLAEAFDRPLALAAKISADVPLDCISSLEQLGRQTAALIRLKSTNLIADLVAKVCIEDNQLVLLCMANAIAMTLGLPSPGGSRDIKLTCQTPHSGRAFRHSAEASCSVWADQAFVRLIVQAHRWWAELKLGEINITELALRERRSASYVTRVLRLAFLAPSVAEAILKGRQRNGWNARELTRIRELSREWRQQELVFLPRAAGV